jgi:hypothetical protein
MWLWGSHAGSSTLSSRKWQLHTARQDPLGSPKAKSLHFSTVKVSRWFKFMGSSRSPHHSCSLNWRGNRSYRSTTLLFPLQAQVSTSNGRHGTSSAQLILDSIIPANRRRSLPLNIISFLAIAQCPECQGVGSGKIVQHCWYY